MSAHTSGPWTAQEERLSGASHVVGRSPKVVKGGITICEVMRTLDARIKDGRCAEAEANARLIAAAPDLLAALKTLAAEERRDDDDPVLMAAREQARAAIACAEGK